MRFVTEFVVPESAESHKERKKYIPEKRYVMEAVMGNMIAKSFDWQNPVNHNLDHHRLEIEAFPMKKWVEFKKALFSHMDEPAMGQISPVYILQLIKNLESFGKPAGEQLTNPHIKE
jgi:hypothetical protein